MGAKVSESCTQGNPSALGCVVAAQKSGEDKGLRVFSVVIAWPCYEKGAQGCVFVTCDMVSEQCWTHLFQQRVGKD